MRNIIQRCLRLALVAGLALVFSTTTLNAEQLKGKFTLPFDTFWGGVLVPAGDYTFTLDTTRERPLTLRNRLLTVYALVGYTEKVDTAANSQIVIVRGAQKAMVHLLYLSSAKTAFHFNVPERYEVTTKILAQSSDPAGIERIPVTSNGY